ncbi:type II toxin-antitoxin system Phd/YefM family antitoxin [Methylobacterium sp. A54F]
MDAFSLAEAKARLGELVKRVEAGDTVAITRDGEPVAQLVAPQKPRRRIERDTLRNLTAEQPLQVQGAADLVRSMRDGDRF